MYMWKRNTRIYADAAAATPLSARVKKEMQRLIDVYGNPGALHKEALTAKHELEHARDSIAAAIGGHHDEIIFTASGTEGNNLAIQGVLRPMLREYGELHAVTCAIEHQSVLGPLHALEHDGLYVTELPVDEEGLVDPKALAESITDETVFVSVQLVNSEVGTIEPVREIAREIRRIKKTRTNGRPLYFHTDASQAPLWLALSVEKLGVDLMTLDAQKVLGPKGVGVLYVRRGTKIESVLWGGQQERGLRGGTENVLLAGAFAVALEDAQKDIEARVTHVSAVRDFLIQEIHARFPRARINGPSIERRDDVRVANNVNVSIPGLDAQMGVIALDAKGIATSTRSACNTGDTEPSHVIQALNIPEEYVGSAIRITLLPSVTMSDAKQILQALSEVVALYGKN